MEVAVKTLPWGLRDEEDAIRGFLREAHTWSKLNHENVLPLRGIATEFDHTISLVSEWMEKRNAHDYVQSADVDPRPVIKGIANGLKYLHCREAGMVVHGDLKGINVLISNNGQALLTDFGLSCLSNSSCSVSRSDPAGGSLRWSAPEVLDGAVPSAAADVWAFGMTVLELFTRKYPFPDLNGQGAIVSRISHGPLPLRPTNVDTQYRMTDEWWAIVCWCWKHKPTERTNISTIVENIKHIVCFFIEKGALDCSSDIPVLTHI
ncbi:hypothetical protein ID866_9218 [Astraeus odoratus]|nr:hypothetical protein ID866_9218 [Astraeus odoratus]